MDYTYKVLESDLDLLAAALSEVPVAVAVKEYEDDILEDGGRIRIYPKFCSHPRIILQPGAV